MVLPFPDERLVFMLADGKERTEELELL